MTNGFTDTAKKYILYRSRRSELRKSFGLVPEVIKQAVEESSKYFSSLTRNTFFTSFTRVGFQNWAVGRLG